MEKSLEGLVKRLQDNLTKTQTNMYKRLNDHRIANISGKLRNSIKDIKFDKNKLTISYQGPFYSAFIDARRPVYRNFKSYKKLPTNFLEPLRKLLKMDFKFLSEDIKKELVLEITKQFATIKK